MLAPLYLPLLLSALVLLSTSQAFTSHVHSAKSRVYINYNSNSQHIQHHDASRNTALHATTIYKPIFDFTLTNPTTKQKSASSFERIDDAIMGGISQSALRDIPNKSYASWSGVCRTDGGGFCGMRTLPSTSPLNATNSEGIYLDCNLVSDNEANRRIWKMTVRTDSSRGEMVYQAEYDLQKAMDEAAAASSADNGESWARVIVPFDQFQLVRGPRLVPDSPKLNVTGGIYQIGMTLSKFKMAQNTTELDNFRPGYFDMHIKQIGFYNNNKDEDDDTAIIPAEKVMPSSTTNNMMVPDTLTKEEAEKKRPMVLKMLLPIAKIFFSEQANRRKSAMRKLREERKLSRFQAIAFGIKWRKHSMGIVPSICKTLGILSIDSFRAVVKNVLKIVVVYPLRVVGAIVRIVKKMLGMKVKPSLRE